eukprot:m.89429 g.89429  ORF g.89429 m.89429 type:complete len:98 (+) comp36607_c0_seq33:394-687(+)
MVRPKKKSNRTPIRKKYNIQKKVREHRRKERKAAKKRDRPERKKDPGIPNLLPFKEELLKEAEAAKRRKVSHSVNQLFAEWWWSWLRGEADSNVKMW